MLYRKKTKTLILSLLLTPLLACNHCNGDPPQKTANFKYLNVYPEFRCPGEEVRVSWATSPDTPIKIKHGSFVIDQPGSGDYVIKAGTVDAAPNPFKVTVSIDTSGGESRDKTVRTLKGTEDISRTGTTHNASQYQYKIDLPDPVWSPAILVEKLKLQGPKYFKCTSKMGTHNDWYLSWQVDKTLQVTGYLNKTNNYIQPYSPPAKAQGIWYYKITNPNNTCLEWKNLNKIPSVWYSVKCKK